MGGIIRDMTVTMMERAATLLLVLILTTLSSTSLAFVPLTLPRISQQQRQVPFTYVRYLRIYPYRTNIITHSKVSCMTLTHSLTHSSLLFSVLHSQRVEETNDNTAIPPNLRRKVRAKRPPRGHVIPRSKKVKGVVGGSSNPRLRPQGKAREAGLNNPSNIKIIGGSARGRRLDSPQVYLRPMMAKVKEALFSTLTSFGMYDNGMATRHLDVFAGSGSVGLESLSRGATHCTFVDVSQDCCAAMERNVQWCQFLERDQTQIVCADYLLALREPPSVGISTTVPYDIITLSPPYEEVVYAELLEAVVNSPLVGEDTVVVVEYPVELGNLPHVVPQENGVGAMVGVRNRKYGRTLIAIYVVNPSGNLKVADCRPEEFV
jgi:16S rRNA (guanine(966)-N(2))-methyltransferase RsmD